MIDRTRAGVRCRTIRFVRTVEGDLPRDAGGTIRYETENLGRLLVLVLWGGISFALALRWFRWT